MVWSTRTKNGNHLQAAAHVFSLVLWIHEYYILTENKGDFRQTVHIWYSLHYKNANAGIYES